MWKKLRNSFKTKKKKPMEEKIPDGLQQRIKTPGDRIDCSLEKWSEGEISISSVEQNIPSCFTPVQDSNATSMPMSHQPAEVQVAPAKPTRSDKTRAVLRVQQLGGQCVVPLTSEFQAKLKQRQTQQSRVSPSAKPSPPIRTKSLQQKINSEQKPKPAPRKSLQTSKRQPPTPVPRQRSRQPAAQKKQTAHIGKIFIDDVKSPIEEGNFHEERTYLVC